LTPLGTAFNNHAGIDYQQQSRSVVVSANYPTGRPNNFELIDGGGSHFPFSNVAGIGGALKIATARDDGQGASLGGFRTGELFSGTGLPGQVARIAPDGAAVQNPWVSLQGEAGLPGGLHVDRTGVFGGDLIVVTDAGGVWRINSSGTASRVASLNTPLHGVTTVPDDAAKYGPWAGKILAGAKEQRAVYAIDAQGGATSYALGVSPEDIRLVPAHENFFGLDTAEGKLWGAPADAFTALIGDILVAQESPGTLTRVRWNGTAFETGQLAQVASWGQTTFAPAALAEIRVVKQVYDKIAVVRHAPVLNSGRVEGALWQLSGENVSLSGNTVITSDLLVPGKPTVMLGGHPSFGGVLEGVEDARPTGYSVSMSGNASLRHLITRTNPIELKTVATPPAPAGARDVSVTKEGQGVGDFSTLRNLSLSGKAGAVSVPPGTYGSFSASGRTTLVLGAENATEPAVYNLQGLTLSGSSDLRLAGPVVLTVGGGVSLSGSSAGAADNPRRLLLKVAEGEIKVSGNGVLYGVVRAPQSAVNISGNGRLRGTVTCDRLTVSGNGVIQITENDITPPPVNRPPTADAGADQTITLPANTVSLNGTVSDDGLPRDGTLSVNWKVSSGPGPVSFGSPTSASTTATFAAPGVYVLKLTASDGRLTRSDTTQVEVVPRNQPPVVNAGPDVTVKLPNPVNLNGTFSDDALPRGSNVAVNWSVTNGPAAVSFSDANAAATSATFGAPGTYTLRLSASDTELTAFDELVVTVTPANQPPTADAGPDQTVSLDETLPAPEEFRLRTISTGFNSPIGIDYHPPTGKVIMSVNYNSGGQPFNFETVAADGTHAPFSNIHGLTDELKLATVRDDAGGGRSIGGFQAGELFTGSGVPGVIVRVSPDGSTVQNPWVTLPGESGLMRGSLYVDRTGVYGGDLIVVTTSGGVWRVNSAGQPTKLAQIPTHLEGLSTIPDVPERYGPWAGKILIGAENERRFYAVDAQGHTNSYDIGISPEDIDIIPAKENFFGVAFGNGALMGAPASAFNGMVGDLLVTQEFGTLFRVRWNGTEFEKTALASVAQWEHVTFAPAGIVEIPPVGATVTLDGSVTDDAAPGFPLSVFWQKVSGPGAVTFTDPTRPVTQAVFNQPGTYVLRLTADDTEFAASDEVTVEVTSPIPPLTDATLKLSPEAAGPNVTGTAQKFRATLLDRRGFPIIGAPVRFNVVGPNATSGDAPTNFVGVAEFSYTGSANGDDKVSARASAGSLLVESNQAAVSWVTPVQRISTTTVLGRFFTSNGSGAFNAQPSQTPVFSQFFPTINFNPPAGTVPGNTSGVDEWTRPFTDVTTDLNGNFTGTIPAQGNGYVAGIHGPLFDFNAVFTGSFTVAAPGNVTFNFFSDDGFVFGVGGGAVRVGGALSNPPPSGRTPFEDMPVMGAYNNATAPVANGVTVFFPAAGSYPYEVDYSECCNAQLALTMTTAESGNHGVPPTGSLALGPNSPAPREAGQQQTFTVSATDASGSPMAGAPLRLSVSGANARQLVSTADAGGHASFTYTGANVGSDSLQVSAPVGATVAYSNVVTMRWNVANQPPAVNAGADLSVASVSDAASLGGSVTDDGLPVGAPVTSAWTKVSGPGPVTFSNPGVAVTTATFGVAGVYVLRLSAGDSLLSASDDLTVTVNGTNQPPEVSAGPDLTITLPKTATLDGAATDDGLPTGSTLAVSWSRVSGPGAVTFNNPNGAATAASFSEAGTYVLRLTASDSELSAGDDLVVTVSQAVPPPVVSIASLPDGAEVTTRVNVVGSVSAGSNWRLEHAHGDGGGAANWTTLASGAAPVTNGLLGVFDPTLLLNGTYTLRLVASDAAGQTTETSVALVVNGEQKIGNFSISFSDLAVPVAGLPIEVTRTYDSRDKSRGDFGVGWTLGIKNVRVEKSGVLGAGWEQTRSGGFLPTYCLAQTRPRFVTITFPGGKVYQFRAVTSPQCSVLVPIQTAVVGFAPAAGTRGSLTALGDNDVLVTGDAPGPAELIGFDALNPYNPTRFRLTSEDGTVFIIDQTLGVRSVVEPNGNTLSIDAAGITHSSGKSVTFARDAQGRITQITDPSGNALTYVYDAAGDLVTFRDREGNSHSFSYNSTHGLLTVTDPRGIRPLDNEYDADGRLVRQTDALGKSLSFTHDLDARRELVTDRLGRVIAYEYDARGNVVRVTDAGGGVTTRIFDARDNLLSETDALGRAYVYTYDGEDNRTSAADPLGNTVRYTHNARGQVLTLTDALGRVTTNTYDENGNLVSVRDPLGTTVTSTYDQRGLLTRTTDALGNTTTLDYDAAGNVTRRIDQLGNVTAYSYDANGNRLSDAVTRTTPEGPETLTTSYRYDRAGRPTFATLPDGSTAEAVVNSLGRASARIDQLGRRTAFEYDEMGRLAKVTHPDGTAERSVFDAEGQLVKSVDRAGGATTYEYDAAGMLLKTTLPDGSSTSSVYNALGLVTASTDAGGHTTTYEYDAAGRRTKFTNALGQSYAFAYDADGNLASATDQQGRATRFQYDAAGRRTKIVFPDDTTQTTAYDAAGRATARADQAGRATLYEYDALGRLTKVTDALGGLTRYTYDELGNRLTQTDANNRTATFAYDNMNRLVRRTLPLGMSETYAYAADGGLKSHTDFRGMRTVYEYDESGRLTKKAPDASLNEPAVSFTYTAAGQRATMTDVTGTTSYAYDAAGRLKSKSTPHGALAYTYDAAGNVRTLRSLNPDGVSADYSYDELHRLSAVRDNRFAATAAAYAYDTNGNLANTLYANGVRTSYAYDALDRLTNVSAEAGGGALASYAYTLGPAGNRLSVTEAGGRTVSYTYDALYRLTEERVSGGAPNGVVGYTYDAVGNRLSRSSSVPGVAPAASSYDANNRLESDAYDLNGNTVGSQGAAYSFDYESRLTSVNGGAVRYVYDGDGNRVAKTAGGVTTRYLVDTNNPTGYAQVVEESVGGQVTRQYTYGHSLISQRRLDGGVWRTSFYGYDGQHSVRYLTDESGAVTDAYTYDAFGNLLARSGTTPNEYLFAGERFDAETGLYYLRARFLQPDTGRFWSMDDYAGNSFDPPSLHKYTYTRNDPVNHIDPSGNQEFSLMGTLRTLSIVNVLTIAVSTGLTYIAHNRLITGKELLSALVVSNSIALFMILGPVFLAPKFGVSSAFFAFASNGVLTSVFTTLGIQELWNAKTNRQRAAAAIGLVLSVVLGFYGLRANSKSPAQVYADEVQASYVGPSSKRPATVTVIETPAGKDFRGGARGARGLPENLNPEMGKALARVPDGSWEKCGGLCAEIEALNEMLNRGINPRGSVLTTARVRNPGNPQHGTPHDPCPTCTSVMEYFQVTYQFF
jgi:RHS repeat-associated protein